ncbi:hypothetical protein R20943_04390 [Paraburkholderia aspalathi]|nr:hypothetical protein R20943_04390 [Paraburkholderia aspalathi]
MGQTQGPNSGARPTGQTNSQGKPGRPIRLRRMPLSKS